MNYILIFYVYILYLFYYNITQYWNISLYIPISIYKLTLISVIYEYLKCILMLKKQYYNYYNNINKYIIML